MKKCNFLLVFIFTAISLFGQELNFSALTLSKELKENANAVIRLNSTVVDVLDVDEMEISVTRIVTVLNKLGNNKVRSGVGYDNNSKISKLSAVVYNAFGKEIKKFKKNDFLDVSAVDGGTLYSDSRVKYLEYTPISYPYTIKLTYVKKTVSTGFLPNWNPIEGYLVSLENSNFTVNLKFGKARVKEKNFDGLQIKKENSETKIYYSLSRLSWMI